MHGKDVLAVLACKLVVQCLAPFSPSALTTGPPPLSLSPLCKLRKSERNGVVWGTPSIAVGELRACREGRSVPRRTSASRLIELVTHCPLSLPRGKELGSAALHFCIPLHPGQRVRPWREQKPDSCHLSKGHRNQLSSPGQLPLPSSPNPPNQAHSSLSCLSIQLDTEPCNVPSQESGNPCQPPHSHCHGPSSEFWRLSAGPSQQPPSSPLPPLPSAQTSPLSGQILGNVWGSGHGFWNETVWVFPLGRVATAKFMFLCLNSDQSNDDEVNYRLCVWR